MKRWWVVLLLLVIACDQDPFHKRTQPVLNGYRLQQWEDSTTYYLIKDGDEEDSGGGVLQGTVQRIGWNDRYILAKRTANFGGDASGWMIIDAQTDNIAGPFSDAEVKSHPEVAGITPRSSAEAWRRNR